jgi:8-oxo-dGTP pyrophosphatase MutT (NUDIX family)
MAGRPGGDRWARKTNMKKDKAKLVASSYLILIKNGKILLSRRTNTGFYDGHYSLVAGHLKYGESFSGALVREVKEEANISLKNQDFYVIHIMHRSEKANPPEIRERIDVFFRVKKYRGEIKNNEPQKCDDLNWFPLDRLPKKTIPYVKAAIENIRKKKLYSEFGFKI